MGPASALNPIIVLKPGRLRLLLMLASSNLQGSNRITGFRSSRSDVNEGGASNVLARSQGMDTKLEERVGVLSAHYDHLGSHDVPAGQDGIWNGVTTMPPARQPFWRCAKTGATSRQEERFIFSPAVKTGAFWGTAYYGAHPIAHLERVVVQITWIWWAGLRVASKPSRAALRTLCETAELGKKHAIEVIPEPAAELAPDLPHRRVSLRKVGCPGVEFFTAFTRTTINQRYREKIRYQDDVSESI